MKVCQCPTCGAVMHRVPEVTEHTARVGTEQLIRHAMEEHVLPGFEHMLKMMVEYDFTGSRLMLASGVVCIGCGVQLTTDNGIYAQIKQTKRTAHCCSQECYAKVTERSV